MTTSLPASTAAATSSTVLTPRALPRRPGLVRPGPWSSSHPRIRARRAAPRRAQRRRRRLEHERTACHEDDERAARNGLRRPDTDRAPLAAPTREPPARARRSPPEGRTAGSRRRGPTGPREARGRGPTRETDRELRSQRVRARNLERIRRGVDPRDPRAWVLVGDRERDRATPVPTSRTRGSAILDEPGEAPLDDDLRLRTGNEHAPIDGERQPPEPPLAEHVRQRLTRLAPRHQPLELLLLTTR